MRRKAIFVCPQYSTFKKGEKDFRVAHEPPNLEPNCVDILFPRSVIVKSISRRRRDISLVSPLAG
jgi:hypothetical protein